MRVLCPVLFHLIGRSRYGVGMLRRAVTTLALAFGLMACSGGSGRSGPMGPAQVTNNRIAGVWRVTSYIPEHTLSPALLLGMQSDKIVIRFDNGRLRSVTTNLSFDRVYRLANISGDHFTIFVRDDTGVEYESIARFDAGGRITFRTMTPPWTGQGVLEREGPAMNGQER
jgi:hypothetical protein